jgi:hypothetical protein
MGLQSRSAATAMDYTSPIFRGTLNRQRSPFTAPGLGRHPIPDAPCHQIALHDVTRIANGSLHEGIVMKRHRTSTTSLCRHPLAACIVSWLALGSGVSVCRADVLQVLNCNDSGTGSLRATVASAQENDTIDLSTGLACSRITLTSGGITTGLENLSIIGPGPSKLTIDGHEVSPQAVLSASSNASGTFYVGYLTVANGRGVGPGCIYAQGDLSLRAVTVTGCTTARNVGGAVRVRHNLTMVNSTLSNNAESDNAGGGGAWVDGDASVTNSLISGNSVTTQYGGAPIYAGGIYVAGNLRLIGSTVANNSISTSTNGTAVAGGGIFVKGDAYLSHSIVSGNSVSGADGYARGGGIYVGSNAGPTDYAYFGYSTVSGNSVFSSTTGSIAHVQGGGVYSAKPFGFKFSTIDHNQSNSEGGGIAAGSAAHLNVVMSTLSGNVAQLQGGAIFTRYGKAMLLLNSTIGLNSTRSIACAGIFFYNGGTLTAESSILANNTKYNSTDECDIGGSQPLTISATNGHNLIQNSVATVPGDTISGDPQFFPLANNGGPTRTLGIAQSSPARLVGSNLFSLSSDQRGPGYPRTIAGETDIGAFEWQRPGDGDTIFVNGFELFN